MQFRPFILTLFFLLVFYPVSSLASTWAKSYGDSNYDQANSIQQTSDGGYIVAGFTYHDGSSDCWILKLDANGNVTWQKTYGGTGISNATSIQVTSDGGYIVAGYTYPSGAVSSDCWVLKLDPDGNVTWQKTYGGSGSNLANSIQQTSDGGYIVAGDTYAFGAGLSDYWVLKLDADGNVTWQKTYGRPGVDQAKSIQVTSDGGYILAGHTYDSSNDYLILKLDADGNVAWQKTYSGLSVELAASIQVTSDGGYILAGYTGAYSVLKLDANGNVTWQKTYGGSKIYRATSIQQTSDGGYIVAGFINSYGDGYDDYLILKLDADGNVTWQKTYGDSNYDIANSIQQTSDGGYIVAGYTKGTDHSDFWVLKLDANGSISGCGLIGDIAVVSGNTSLIPEVGTAVAADTSITPQTSSAVPQNTSATTAEQCFYEVPGSNDESTPFPWELFYPAFIKK